MRTIALLTDFGLDDNYVGVIKAVILKINPNVNLVDVSHSVRPQDVLGAAFLLKGSYNFFPRNTIFLVVIDPGVGSRRKPTIIRTKNYFFVGPDNGVLHPAACEDGIKEIINIENKIYFLKDLSNTFHGRDIFAPVAAYLSKDRKLESFGTGLKSVKEINMPKPKIGKNTIKGEIIYIDRFGNLISNIDKNLFARFIKNKRFRIEIKDKKLNSIVKSYAAVRVGQPLAIFGSFNFLEISVTCGNAKDYFHVDRGEAVYLTRLD